MSRDGMPGLTVTGGSKVPGCSGIPSATRMLPAPSTTSTSSVPSPLTSATSGVSWGVVANWPGTAKVPLPKLQRRP